MITNLRERSCSSSTPMPEIMRADVPGDETRVRIWTNHPTEPDDIVIALG